MAFVVVIKKINSSIQPVDIFKKMNDINIPLGNNIKYYKKKRINVENDTYTLCIKFHSFDNKNEKMCKFHNDLIYYKWILLEYDNNTIFKISMKSIDYYNYMYSH